MPRAVCARFQSAAPARRTSAPRLALGAGRARRTYAAAVALAGLASAACSPQTPDFYAVLPAEGAVVPAFRYPALHGATIADAGLRGRPSVVALWSSSCSASRRSLGALAALTAAYEPRGARVLVLADDSERERGRVDSLLAGAGLRAPVALTHATLIDTFTHDQSPLPWRKAFALPTFLVLDARGRVAYRQIGIEVDAGRQLRGVRAALDSLLLPAPPTVASGATGGAPPPLRR